MSLNTKVKSSIEQGNVAGNEKQKTSNEIMLEIYEQEYKFITEHDTYGTFNPRKRELEGLIGYYMDVVEKEGKSV